MSISDFLGRIGISFDAVIRVSSCELIEETSTQDIEGIELGNADRDDVFTDSNEKPTPNLLARDGTANWLRVMNDAVYQPAIEYYRNFKLALEVKYANLLHIDDSSGVHNFYSKFSKVIEFIDSPDSSYILQPGDVISLAHSANIANKITKTMPWSRSGLTFFGGVSPLDFKIFGKNITEVTISPDSALVGVSLKEVSRLIYRRYMSATLSIRSSKDVLVDRDSLLRRESLANTIVKGGDVLVLVTGKEGLEKLALSTDFTSITGMQSLPEPPFIWSFYPVLSFFVIVSLVAAQQVEMTAAALSMASFFFIGGWLEPSDIERFVDIRLLMLMGSSLSFAKAMTTTGLAAKIADSIASGVANPMSNLFLIYIATLLVTELISNNAAAALLYPVSVALADNLRVSYKPFAMVVMQAASMAFMCPIGYPTHVMVWRPGNYTFADFCRFGFIPNIIWMILSCLISAAVWPF